MATEREQKQGEQERGIQRGQSEQRAMAAPRGGGVTTPFGFVRRMMEDMDRLFGFGGPRVGGLGLLGGGPAFQPDIEVFQSGDKLIVRADLPGMNENDVNVQLTDDGLVIEGERRYEHEETERGVFVSERSYGRFQRLIPLPRGVDASNIDASFENGVLQIALPLPQEEQRRRQIDIKGKKGEHHAEAGQAKQAGVGGQTTTQETRGTQTQTSEPSSQRR